MMSMLPSVFPVACHTDNIGPGSIFVAIKGAHHDGAEFIPQALEKGATHIVVDCASFISDEVKKRCAQRGIILEYSDRIRTVLAELSAYACGYPAQKLKIIGVTGTKGKTTSCFMLEHCLRTAGHKTALLSTVRNQIDGSIFPTNLTTQHPDYLQVFLKTCVEWGVEYVVMEVAAQAISLSRVHGILFDLVIFTNFSTEHGEFYASQEDYFAAKSKLLDQCKPQGTKILNADNIWCRAAVRHHNDAVTIGMHNAHYQGVDAKLTLEGSEFGVRTNDGSVRVFSTPLIGEFNIYNWLGVVAAADALHIPLEHIKTAIKSFRGAPGRLELYELPNGARCYIDYAHNPASFEAVLSAMRPYTDHLIAVFGAGGDRDPARRPLMGKAAAHYANVLILTSDNPRSEDPQGIVADIMTGIDQHDQARVIVELDREAAIKKAYFCSRSSSIIVLLGKGPEEYQIVRGNKIPFSERAVVQALKIF
jgi:UDP-N-acetylmuramoyl-L-alanyl-D-glutamate--2,6-diaminopimelate ligase